MDSRIPNRCEFGVWRPLPATNGIERFFSFTTRSPIPGREGAREIWLHRNVARAGLALPTLEDARLPLLRDPTGAVSYLDPAWGPDGRFLAYLRTNWVGATPGIYVQEFKVSEDIHEAVTPIGAPIEVVAGAPGVAVRRPDWSPDGTHLAYESTAAGPSYDLYTIQVFPTLGTPVRRTFLDFNAEQAPAYSPDGTRLAFQVNLFGAPEIAILDLATGAWQRADPFAGPVDHNQPDWSSDGGSIYYHAPKNEDLSQLSDIWKLDLETKARCSISIDINADADVDVSGYLHESPDGIPFNYFLFTTMTGQAAGIAGPHVWRGEHIYNCFDPLPMGVQFQPNTLQLGSLGNTVTATLSFPPETIAAGYQSASFDGPLEGVRMRNTIVPSPTLEGLVAKGDPATGNVLPVFVDRRQGGAPVIDVTWNRREVESFLLTRGLLGKNAPIRIDAYSNGVGRAFRGFGYIKVTAPGGGGGGERIVLEQNTPNPFNPATVIRFAMGAPGNVTVRIFDARGRLVRSLGEASYPQGRHAVSWDGRDDHGRDVPSGVYYAAAMTGSGTSDRIKMVLAR